MAKETMKSHVLNIVQSQGSARYTDIIRFIVDRKFGKGTYEWHNSHSYRQVPVWSSKKNEWSLGTVNANKYRGYYASAMTRGGMYHPQGYFLTGPDRLVKGADGLYRVERQA
jgi:hypothetical protein